MDCEVLRCGKPAADVLDISRPGSGPMDAGVCAEHKAAIDQGARWAFEQEEGNEGRVGRLLMGRDLPPRALQESSSTRLNSSDGMIRVFSFMLEKHDGDHQPVQFELPPEVGDFVLTILKRDRGQTGRS